MLGAKRAFQILSLGLIAILIQGAVLKSIFPSLIIPNLILILVVYLAFYEPTPFGSVLVFLLGLEFDLSSAKLLGPWAGAFVVVFILFSLLSQRLFVESVLAAIVVTFVAALVASGIYGLLAREFNPAGSHSIVNALVEALLTALCAPLLIRLLRKLYRRRESGLPGRYVTRGA